MSERPEDAPGTQFRVRSGPVVHEKVEDEVIVINLDNGTYYSLAGVAAAIWQRLSQPTTLAAVVSELAAAHEESLAAVHYVVVTLARQLLADGLILADRSAELPDLEPPQGLSPQLAAATTLERYSDVAELLMLDPVHDVDDVGWPVKGKDLVLPAGEGAL